MLKIFISNLKEYNEGQIIGEWVDLPCEGLEEVLDKISNNGNDELFISDYETDISGLKVSEYDNILELNDLITCRMMKLSHFKHTWNSIQTIYNKLLTPSVKAIIEFIIIATIWKMSHIKLLMIADYLTEYLKKSKYILTMKHTDVTWILIEHLFKLIIVL